MDPALICKAFFVLGGITAIGGVLIPSFRRNIMNYGSRSTLLQEAKGKGSMNTVTAVLEYFASCQVPHNWFTHYYAVSVASSVFWAIQILRHGQAFEFMVFHSNPSGHWISINQTFLAWAMMTLQGTRRLYESITLTKSSESKMWIGLWILGIAYYIVMGISVWVEGISALTISDSPTSLLEYGKPSLKTIVAVPLFLLGSTECLIYMAIAIVAAPKGRIFNTTILTGLVFVTSNLGVTADSTRRWYIEKFGTSDGNLLGQNVNNNTANGRLLKRQQNEASSFSNDIVKVSLQRSAHDEAEKDRLEAMEIQDESTPVSGRISPTGPAVEINSAEVTTTMRSLPPAQSQVNKMDVPLPNMEQSNGGMKSDSESEAETIVLPGKDGHSPSKTRKSIKHEDRSDDEEMRDAPIMTGASARITSDSILVEKTSDKIHSSLGKRKRKPGYKDDIHHGNSSGLSSVPTSPVATTRSSLSKPAASESDVSKSPSPPVGRSEIKSVDRVISRRRQYSPGSGDESESRSVGRQRSSGAETKQNNEHPRSSKSHIDSRSQIHTRSLSPQSKVHKRSQSTQLPSKSTHGLSHKKKRVPAPLQSTEYHSDDSSGSGSSRHRSSRLRHLAAPTTGNSTISSGKMAPHKKNIDSSGQTLLARACASGRVELVRQRLLETPEYLNRADNALNSPLHIASINGYDEIVKVLLDHNCTIDTVNYEGDTPLHDAIENGMVEVVKLLLDAGANPRKPNKKGEEPLELVSDQNGDDVEAELREAITAAKQRNSEARYLSEEHDDQRSHSKDSPRHTPPAQSHDSASLIPTNRRVGSSRSTKTSDRGLYQAFELKDLRNAAAAGNSEAVVHILLVKESQGWDDPSSLIAAAKGGHADVINVLFAIGHFNPDPDFLEGESLEYATPMLAAIGREKIEVVKLILDQELFDPTRRINDETYSEIARKRGGPKWREEEDILKKAFDKYTKGQKGPLVSRTRDREAARVIRDDSHHPSQPHKKDMSSPGLKEPDARKGDKATSSATQNRDTTSSGKRGPGRPRKEESITSQAISDRESTPLGPPKRKPQPRKSESDIDNETVKPRRKLVSGTELKGKLEKQRRASITSNTSNASVKDKRGDRDSDPKESKPGDEPSGKVTAATRKDSRNASSKNAVLGQNDAESTAEKAGSDRARSLKRDDSKDRLSAIRGAKSPVKRHRSSATPPRSGMEDILAGYGTGGAPPKRRKLEGDSRPSHKEEITPSSSPDQRSKSGLSRETATKSEDSPISGPMASVSKDNEDARQRNEHEAAEMMRKREADRRAEHERIEQAKQARQAREKLAREEETKRQQEESEKKERQRQEDEENRRLRYVEQEKQKREDQERRRAAALEQARAERVRVANEKELERLKKLPPLLRWLDQAPKPDVLNAASTFRHIQGFRFDSINSEASGTPGGREQWILNTDVALLLGEKDLEISRYPGWDRIPLSITMKDQIMQYDRTKYSLMRSPSLKTFYQQLGLPIVETGDLHNFSIACGKLFCDLDIFVVKLSEFLFIIPNFPHLRDVKVVISYGEFGSDNKFTKDPDYDQTRPFIPPPKEYVNGMLVRHPEVPRTRTSHQPLGCRMTVQRPKLIGQVYPHDPDFSDLARSQGAGHLIPEGYQVSSSIAEAPDRKISDSGQMNGITPPNSVASKSINGGSPHHAIPLAHLTNGTGQPPQEMVPEAV
ncbi:hypothetical protein B7494_g3921 [Chlorociboria aeruginascens]|nr:hypothetical protein B7494_g3921 [Chlorociboria aeruginascens]